MDEWRERHQRLAGFLLLIVRTARGAVRIRIVGLAAEAAFFSLLSLPALLLGIVGVLGHLAPVLGAETVEGARQWIVDLAAAPLTTGTVDSVVVPLIDDFLRGAHGGVLSLTFLVSLWSGSRAMNVFIDAITIAYGLDGLRGFVWQRALAFIAYIGALLFALIVLPALVAGPNLIEALLPAAVGYLHLTYWPVVGGISAVAVVLLYTLSVPVRMPLLRHLPGALLAMVILLLGSALLRIYLDASLGQVTIYGTLAAPIAILIWLWVMALAVLVGSALNAEIDAMWPTATTAEARAQIAAQRHARATRLVERREQALRDVAEDGAEAEGSESEGTEEDDASREEREAAGQQEGSGSRGPEPPEPARTQTRKSATGEESSQEERGEGRAPTPRTGAYPAHVENEGTRGDRRITSGRAGVPDRSPSETED